MGLDVKAEKDEFAATVNDAVRSIKSELDDFTRFVTDKKAELVDIFKLAGGRTGDQLNGIADEMRASGDHALTMVARTVSNNPLTAVAIAAGAGMLIGMMSAGGRR
jgi:ElaB/YqjD/DUF883 family membrane-anchored ribosome-binding protein